MTPAADFIAGVESAAVSCAEAVGWWPSTVIAQWCNETGYGSSPYWYRGNNPAGISPGGQVASYPTHRAGYVAWMATARSHYYDGVRAAHDLGPDAEAIALGRSPWAGGHYVGIPPMDYPGGSLVGIIAVNGLTRYNGPPQPDPGPGPAPAPAPHPPVEILEETVTAVVLPNGDVKVYAQGAGTRAGQLLEFTRRPSDTAFNEVIDVTDQIGGPDPYTVAP